MYKRVYAVLSNLYARKVRKLDAYHVVQAVACATT